MALPVSLPVWLSGANACRAGQFQIAHQRRHSLPRWFADPQAISCVQREIRPPFPMAFPQNLEDRTPCAAACGCNALAAHVPRIPRI
ncbi:hypothetical protein FKP32DRAFT_1383547 [Trametes sanguinea]|nr:hypothetical protein FKP32DRAFT_1383547 [Trametes sanguinea]